MKTVAVLQTKFTAEKLSREIIYSHLKDDIDDLTASDIDNLKYHEVDGHTYVPNVVLNTILYIKFEFK